MESESFCTHRKERLSAAGAAKVQQPEQDFRESGNEKPVVLQKETRV
jgi:hypothetical protein